MANPTLHNSVMALRLDELSRSTRPFVTRGSRVVRCDGCLLPQKQCICSVRPAPVAESAFLFLMAKGESYKPSNTGRLIADVAKNNFAFSWSRTEPQPELLALLNDNRYMPVIIFPHENAAPERCIHSAPVATGKTPLFIMLDGTWREAVRARTFSICLFWVYSLRHCQITHCGKLQGIFNCVLLKSALRC